MSNEARSKFHRWLIAPDCIAVIEGKHVDVRGALIRQRLSTPVKAGFRAATWDDLDPNDPFASEAFEYRREMQAIPPDPAVRRVAVFRDGVPDPGHAIVPVIPGKKEM